MTVVKLFEPDHHMRLFGDAKQGPEDLTWEFRAVLPATEPWE